LFREAIGKMNDEGKGLDDTSKGLSLLTYAVNQILLITGCPTGCRSYIDGLVGVARGSTEVEVSDKELAKSIRGDVGHVKDDAHEKWVQRKRNAVKKWQEEIGVDFIKYKTGKWDLKNSYQKTRYTLPLIKYAVDIISEAQKNEERWRSNPHFAIEDAAGKIVDSLEVKPVKVTPKKSSAGYYRQEVRTNMRKAKTHLEKAVEFFNDGGFGMLNEDEHTLAEIEGLVEQLKLAVGPFEPSVQATDTEEDEG
jgi:hypothetical protein